MPIELFQQIIKRSFLRDEECESKNKGKFHFIKNYFQINLKEFDSNSLAFNDGMPTIAFFSDADSYIQISEGNKFYEVRFAWLSSQYLEKTYFKDFSNAGDLLIVRFDPVLFYQVFCVSPCNLRKQSVWSLTDSLGHHGQQLLQLVGAQETPEQKLNAIEGFMQRLETITVPNKILEEILQLVAFHKGQVSVHYLIERAKVNYKWLERNFKEYIGLTPKEYIKLQRFIHAYYTLSNSGQSESLLEIAVKHGYYDTSHLQKDLRQFTGRMQF